MDKIEWSDFEKVDLRVGKVVDVKDFPEAIKPAYKLTVDLGELGVKNSSAQITNNYTKEELLGKQVLCVVNFPPKQIANFISEVLVTGVPDENGNVVLTEINKQVPNGARLY